MGYRDKGHQKRLLPASGTMEDNMMDHLSMLLFLHYSSGQDHSKELSILTGNLSQWW